MTDPAPTPPAQPPDLEPGVAVPGQPVMQAAIMPSDAALAADRSNRKARTAAQAFPAAAFVAFVVYVALLAGLDLNSDPNLTEPPTEQVLGLGALVTWGIASWMNRAPRE